jgi:hypothetical protein
MTQVDSVKPGEVLADSSFDKLQDNAKVIAAGQPAAGKPAAGKTPAIATSGSSAP